MIAYLPAVLYLVAVLVAHARSGSLPWPVPAATVAVSVAVHLMNGPWWVPVVGLTISAVLFFGLVLLAGPRISWDSTVALCVTIASVPPPGWVGVAVAITISGVAATSLLWRRKGAAYAAMTALESAAALGVTPAGIGLPDSSRVPAPLPSEEATSGRFPLPVILLAGVTLAWLVVAVTPLG
jgi:hypothetical protein